MQTTSLGSNSPVDMPPELHSFLHNASSLSAVVTREGVVVAANSRFCEVFGYASADELVGSATGNLISEADDTATSKCVRKDGTEFVGEVVKTPWASHPEFVLSIVNVIQRKTAHPQLDTNDWCREVLSNAADGIFIADESGHYVGVNPSGQNMLGYTREEIFTMTPADIVIPEERARLVEEFSRAASGESSFAEWTILRKDGSTFPGEVITSKISNGNVLGVLRDISSRKDFENQLRVSREVLSQFVKRTPAAVAMFDKDMRYLLYSDRWISDYRHGDRDLTGLTMYEVSPETIPWKPVHDKVLAGATERGEKDLFPRSDGSADWVRWEMCPWRDSSGEVGGIIVFSEVMTSTVNATEALLRSEERFRTLVENVPGAVFRCLLKPTYGVPYFSDGIEEMTGYPAAGFVDGGGRPFHTIVHPDDMHVISQLGVDAPNIRGPYIIEFRVIDSVGDIHWVREMGQVVEEVEAGRLWIDGIILDITEQKLAEEELLLANERLEQANKVQKEFLNNITHEVRTPLTAVMGYAKMLLEGVAGPTNNEQSKLLGRVLTSSEQLLDIVSSVLEISRFRSGSIRLRPSVCSPSELIDKAVSSVIPQATLKDLRISVQCPTNDRSGLFDQQKLAIVLNNLLSNAVKFTESGEIRIDLESSRNDICITVVDTGMGICDNDLPAMFDEFKQFGDMKKHKPQGFGIGLSIVAAMVEAMGATLTVSSEKGTGTAFTLWVPVIKG